jgi:hypothetical protein
MNSKDFTSLIFTDFVYVRLKGLIWSCNGLIKPTNLDINAGEELNKIYRTIDQAKPLIVDTKDVINLTDRAWDSLFRSVNELRREITFINVVSSLDIKINLSHTEYCNTINMAKAPDLSAITFFNSIQRSKINGELITIINSKILENIKLYAADSFDEYGGGEERYLHSTPIKANGEFNASHIISDPSKFYWVSLRMADLVREVIERQKIGSRLHQIRLLAVNLRSCPFAASVSLLAGLPLETIDHFGPINRVNEFVDQNPNRKYYDYIFIGDFVVGGTEIKIAQTYAHMTNSKLNNAVVVGSWLPTGVFSGFTVHSLIQLNSLTTKAKFRF